MKSFVWLKSSVIVISVTIALVLLLEFALRVSSFSPSTVVVPKFYANLLGDFEPNIRVINQMPKNYPYKFTTNSQGFRSLTEIDEKKNAEVFRILCLGDSYTMGWGVDDEYAYTELLNKYLKEKYPDKKIEVINAGFLFSNVLDHIDYFREKGRLLKPDLVIEQYCYNDIDTDMRRKSVGRLALRSKGGVYDADKFSLADKVATRTALGALAAQTSARIKGKQLDLAELNGRVDGFMSSVNADLGELLIPPTDENHKLFDGFSVLDADKVYSQRRFWDNYLKGLEVLRDEVERSGAGFLFLAIPTEYQVRDIRDGHSSVFCSFTKERGINFIDMNSVFRRETNKSAAEFFLNADGHTSVKGNDLIAKSISDVIVVSDDVKLSTGACGLNYNDRQDLFIEFDKKNKQFVARYESEIFKSVEIHGKGFENKDDSFCYVAPEGADGELEVDITFSRPISRAEVRSVRRVFNGNDGGNYVNLYYSPGAGQPETMVYSFGSDGSGKWDGAECSVVKDLNLMAHSSRLRLRFAARGKAGLVLSPAGQHDAARNIQLAVFPGMANSN